MRRDGGVPSHPEKIYICPGSQWALTVTPLAQFIQFLPPVGYLINTHFIYWALQNILTVLVNPKASPRTGVLTPVPCHSTTVLSLTALGAVVVPYYLREESGWALEVEELQRALDSAKGVCNPLALYVINPGNPAGYVQSRKSVQEVIRFAAEKRLFLLADEVSEPGVSPVIQTLDLQNVKQLFPPQVYQECVYGEKTEFVSYKRALAEMGPPLSDRVELASFHTASKSFMGE
ncbi:hypothetical protein GOODEAATRI_013237 [Goodea atripinnis]|uniref:alanine transaminase n=1 Tax=Goodea atripinnis TaxID=208336 RepID=A0ABV0PDQ3_9TELE